MPIVSRPSITWPRERWAWVSMALGAGILWFSCQWLYFGLVSRWWTTTTGTVTYSSAHESRRYRSVDIRYRYAVDGREYEGDRFRYGYTTATGRLTSIEVSAAQAAYPVGSHPRVYVDPRQPARSVLEPRAPVEDLLLVGGGLMFLLTPFVRTPRSTAPVSLSTGAAGATGVAVSSGAAGLPRHRAAKVLASLGILTLGLGAFRIERVTRAYPAGSEVSVHFDPSSHERSLLVTQLNWHHAVLPLFAVVFLLLAAMTRAMGRARARAERRESELRNTH